MRVCAIYNLRVVQKEQVCDQTYIKYGLTAKQKNRSIVVKLINNIKLKMLFFSTKVLQLSKKQKIQVKRNIKSSIQS